MTQNSKSFSRSRRVLRWGFRALGWGLAAFTIGWWVLPWCVSLPTALTEARPISARYLAEDGTPLRMLLNRDGEWTGDERSFDEIPRVLAEATLAAEDQRFFKHGGVDLIAIARAARDNWKAGRVVSGASTIHQQLVKISSAKRPRTLWAKVVEALEARRLAMTMDREDVLAAYLNRVPYGNLFTGCAAACEGYFAKPLEDLTAAEAAFLAALPQAPSRLNPFRNPEGVRERQRRILDQMEGLGLLTSKDAEIARAQPIVLQHFVGGFEAPHAVEWLRNADHGAGEVRTTLDSRLQTEVVQIVQRRLEALRDHHATQAAAVVIENETGRVRAWVGSRDFFSDDGGQINGAWTPRSPGSALKPFTYSLAFERGDTPATIVADLPVEFPTESGIYRPENYDLRLFGPMTCRNALANSLNVAAVRVLDRCGGSEALKTRLERLGLTTLTEPAGHYGLGLTIGNAPVRLIELANAYAALARLGESKPWTLLADDPNESVARVIDPTSAWMIADILSDNQARQLTFGRRSPLRFDFPVAVKTGTSSEYRDNWTFGYTPEFTVGVWMGNFDRSPMQNVSGVTGAATILHDVFVGLNERRALTWFDKPDDLVPVRIDPRTGCRLAPSSPPARMSVEESLPPDRLPPPATRDDYDEKGRALLGPEFAEWIRGRDNWLGDLVVLRANPDVAPRLEITHPIDGTILQLDPDLPDSGRVLYLRTRGGEEVVWESSTLGIRRDGPEWLAELTPGEHALRVRQVGSSRQAVSRITVRADGER